MVSPLAIAFPTCLFIPSAPTGSLQSPPVDEPPLSPSPTIDRRGESALVPEAEDPPVPPPRRKRKKKPAKQHSLENLTEVPEKNLHVMNSFSPITRLKITPTGNVP